MKRPSQAKQLILPDTSVWITYFRNRNARLVSRLETMMMQDRVAMNGIILAELVQVLKNDAERETLVRLLGALHALELPFSEWAHVGELSSQLRRKGITLPLTDITIAASAIRHNAMVMTMDAHFQQIPDLSLEMWTPEP
jgi:predicted nucleic acid-binding protein